ncbi:MAG: hypothetical protein PHH08_02940 [Candidatus ainarchaeum sp.]|nr:hypothetical protein [Candidatus ainarchaeum sp.]
MAKINLLKGFSRKDSFEEIKEFAEEARKLRAMVQTQRIIDKEFDQKSFELRKKLFDKQLSPQDFWEQFKELLRKSVKKNDSYLEGIIKKTEERIRQRLGQEQKETPSGYPDLSLPG